MVLIAGVDQAGLTSHAEVVKRSRTGLSIPLRSGAKPRILATLFSWALFWRAMGKCISLQGKEATLASIEIESSTKMLCGLPEHDLSNSHWLNHLDELKSRLRMSFTNFVSRASELHLLSAIQAIERALVGVKEHCIINYEVTTRSSRRAKVSANVSAGIACLDLILEDIRHYFMSKVYFQTLREKCKIGQKKLAVVKRHIQNLVLSLVNVVLHLQGPKIFFRNLK